MDVVVVGAGIAGLSCARELVRGGARVRIAERGRVVGGRLASKRFDGRYARSDAATIRQFRAALRDWGVTTVVMTPGGRAPRYARQWLAAVLGSGPRLEDGAWVWNDVQRLLT